MDAPLTFNGQTPWVNTPEARAELARTSTIRSIKRSIWRITTREAFDVLAGR